MTASSLYHKNLSQGQDLAMLKSFVGWLRIRLTASLLEYFVSQNSDILQHSQNRPTGDRWLKL